jgi:hypothetical protein
MTELQGPSPKGVAPLQRALDTKTVEVLALAGFRTLFGHGIRVPFKKDGLMDMELVVQDSNVLLNMNKVQMAVPELSIWRVTFAYQGKAVVEYGRGIKNDMKVHFPQLIALLFAIWRERRKRAKAMARADAARSRELLTPSLPSP